MIHSEHAQLDWDDQGQPHSRVFGDVYFSRANGLEETRHVFLHHNALEHRFAALGDTDLFVIGETGFGTGLNFLCAWQAFDQIAPGNARLHFISVERYPLQREDLIRALALWPELAHWSEQLIKSYRAVSEGYQRFSFAGGRVSLTLIIDDVHSALPTLDARIDAWFLDGFAPSKNPDMWTLELFSQMARLSVLGTTVATFTSAGVVRRGLGEAGFDVCKVKGYGHKREMLAGIYKGDVIPASKPWFARPAISDKPRTAIVVGAGLAGCATAHSLAQRGWSVTVIERHGEPAQEASGNPQGVLYLKLSAHGTALSRLVISGFGYTRRLLERFERGHDWDDCGVLQLGFDPKEAKRQQALSEHFGSGLLRQVDQAEAQAIAGSKVPAGGLFYPEAGWVHPPALCRAWLLHPSITVITHTGVLSVERRLDGWAVASDAGEIGSAPVVVIASAADTAGFEATRGLPLKRIRGQISYLPASEKSQGLKTVICAEGYIAPPRLGQHTLGASFAFGRTDTTPSEEEHAQNLDLLRALSPELSADHDDPKAWAGRAAFRCTSPDYLPLVGPLANEERFMEAYGILAKDARQVPDAPCPWLNGLYVNTAHGSRGLITAPLSGELVAAWLNDEPLPIPRDVAEACHPNRFMLRRLIRGQA
ncbi:bifunctional tRNA (5-methylaminomethyl-2-thiouridine)(34)-methyltransferase MnmC2/FAD-dependent 5-carboxymethylaminomethyl-2-thiouridine(34) oxidoreductase MnmC1 [Pseudomonas sp. Marseille-QA0892]